MVADELNPLRHNGIVSTPGGTRTPNLLIRSQCGRGAVSLVFRRNPLCCLRIRLSIVLVVSHCFSTSRGPAAAQDAGSETGWDQASRGSVTRWNVSQRVLR